MVEIGRLPQWLTFASLILTSSVLIHYPHSLRVVPLSVKMFLHGNASWEFAPFFLTRNFGSGSPSVRAYSSFTPNLLNTPPSFRPLSPSLFLGVSDVPRLILEKTLGFGSGLLDMLFERIDLSLLLRSPLTSGVLDSESCDTSWIFEFLPEHTSKLRRALTSFSFSCCTFSW
ncbi:hypothetical protein Tco_0825703 [Tanacetum coccineum]